MIKAWSSTYFGHPEVIDPEHVDLREIEVRTDAWGRPAIRLHGAIADSMAGYTVLVSLTHDAGGRRCGGVRRAPGRGATPRTYRRLRDAATPRAVRGARRWTSRFR